MNKDEIDQLTFLQTKVDLVEQHANSIEKAIRTFVHGPIPVADTCREADRSSGELDKLSGRLDGVSNTLDSVMRDLVILRGKFVE